MTTGYARIGLSGDYGISWLLTRFDKYVPGTWNSCCCLVDAKRCEQSGLVNRVVPDLELPDAAFALAKTLAEGPSVRVHERQSRPRGHVRFPFIARPRGGSHGPLGTYGGSQTGGRRLRQQDKAGIPRRMIIARRRSRFLQARDVLRRRHTARSPTIFFISASLYPSSIKTSRECWPIRGAGPPMTEGLTSNRAAGLG